MTRRQGYHRSTGFPHLGSSAARSFIGAGFKPAPMWAFRADATDYRHCKALADTARAAKIEIIRYRTVRDPGQGINIALLTCRDFARAKPIKRHTWHIRFSAAGIQAVCEARNPALHSTAKLSRTIPASPSCVGRAANASRDWRGARRCRGGFQTRPTNGRYVAEPAKSASPDAARKERWLPVITYFAGEEASIFSSRCSAKVSETISRKLSETNCGTNWLG